MQSKNTHLLYSLIARIAFSVAVSLTLLFCTAALHAGEPPGGYPDEMKYPNIISPYLQFGTYGSGIGEFIDPMDVAVGPDEQIYIVDSVNNRVQVFSRDGTPLRYWSTGGTKEPVGFVAPRGIAVSPTGEVYVADTGNNYIKVFSAAGMFRHRWGGFGSADGLFISPHGLAVDTAKVYVADTSNNRIGVFDLKGTFIFSFGGYGSRPGQLNRPTAVAVSERGEIYVCDSDNNRIQKFDARGKLLKMWGAWGSHSGLLATPTKVAYHRGEVYVTDLINHRIQVFDGDGNFLYQWGRHPPTAHEGNGRLHYPSSLAVAPLSGFVVVCEPFENRIQVFSRKGISGVKSVNDSAWWDKHTRFHYGTKAEVAGNRMAISEPDTHFVLLFDITYPIPRFINRFGGFGTEFGQFVSPTGVAIDEKHSLIYVSDKGNHRIQVFSLESYPRFIAAFGRFGTKPGEFNEPGSLALDDDGNLYVIDNENARIQVFSPALQFLRTWGKFGSKRGMFKEPMDISFNSADQLLYVVDAHNYRVQVFDKLGAFQLAWGGPGEGDRKGDRKEQFAYPFGIEARGEFVYVTDQGEQKVKKFSTLGVFITEWGNFGTLEGEFYKPKGIGQDSRGQVIVLDFGNHRGQIFSPDGAFIATFGLVNENLQPTVSQNKRGWSNIAISGLGASGLGVLAAVLVGLRKIAKRRKEVR